MPGIAGHRDAPAEAGARDGEVAQAALDEAHHLVAPRARRDEVRVLVVEFEQPVLPRRQAEEIILLLDPFDLGAGRRATADELALVIEGFVAHGVPAGEAAEIDLAAPLQLLPQRLYTPHMAWLCRADEIVAADIHQPRHVAEFL